MRYDTSTMLHLSYCVNISSQSCILVLFIGSQHYKEFVTWSIKQDHNKIQASQYIHSHDLPTMYPWLLALSLPRLFFRYSISKTVLKWVH